MSQAKKAISKTGGKLAARERSAPGSKNLSKNTSTESGSPASLAKCLKTSTLPTLATSSAVSLSTSDDVTPSGKRAQNAFDRWRNHPCT